MVWGGQEEANWGVTAGGNAPYQVGEIPRLRKLIDSTGLVKETRHLSDTQTVSVDFLLNQLLRTF